MDEEDDCPEFPISGKPLTWHADTCDRHHWLPRYDSQVSLVPMYTAVLEKSVKVVAINLGPERYMMCIFFFFKPSTKTRVGIICETFKQESLPKTS